MNPTHGRNWQYTLTPTVTLLRNIGSVDPAYDGWWLSAAEGYVRIMPQTALTLLRNLRQES